MMKANIEQVAHEGDTAYGLAFYLCANREVIADRLGEGEDTSGNGWADEAAAAQDAGARVILDAGYDYDRVQDFRAYNGGSRKGLVDAAWFTAEIDEDGEPGNWRAAWTSGPGATTIPPAAFAFAESLEERATDAMARAFNAR